MKQKRVQTAAEAVAGLFDGAVLLVPGFGRAGVPETLLNAVCELGVRGLTVVNNNSGFRESGVAKLIRANCVGKLICSFPFAKDAYVFREAFNEGLIELEIVPQGTLAERIRAAGAGLGGVLTGTGVGTELAHGKQVMEIDGKRYLLELPLRGDFAFLHGERVDPMGNLTYRKASRNFNPPMAMAADMVVAEAHTEVDLDAMDPECVVTPGIFVDRYLVVGA